MAAPPTSPYVFISYASVDRERVLAVVDKLEAAGVRMWVDKNAIEGGQSYGPEIVEGIDHCAAFVLMCTPDSLASRNCVQEIRLAWAAKRPYLPLLLDRVTFPEQVRYWLEGWQWVEVLDHPEDEWLPRTLRALSRLGIAAVGDAAAALSTGEQAATAGGSSLPLPAPAVALPATNLPVALTKFVGRARELAEVDSRLRGARLLTLTGAGGSGKTRLALEAGRDALGRYADGVWLVELASLADPALVPQTVATALDVKEQPGRPLWTTLMEALRSRHLLLLLDNCEHLLDACAGLANALLQACPAVQILATSRGPLGVPGEAVYRVPTLALPQLPSGPADAATVHSLLGYDAVQLFVERAQAVQPRFALAPANAAAVAEICRRLDGIPLALELAAARVKMLAVEQLAARLADRFRVVAGGSRTVLPRQQTLRATIDWSYDLLGEPERALFQRLSAFAGGWSIEAAEAICTGEATTPAGPIEIDAFAVLDLLTELVDKSLVAADAGDQEARYSMLDTICEYAAEKLDASGDAESVRARHRDWYLALAEAAEPKLEGPEQAVWFGRLDAEHDNLRAALGTSLAADGEQALREACALWRFWQIRGYAREGRTWLQRAIAASDDAPRALRAKALNRAGALARAQGDIAVAGSLLEQGLALYRTLDDTWGVAGALINLGNVAHERGDLAAAAQLYQECVDLTRQSGGKQRAAIALQNGGVVAWERGDAEQGAAFLAEALSLYQELGDNSRVSHVIANAAFFAGEQRDYTRAIVLCQEGMETSQQLADKQRIAEFQWILGTVAREQGEIERSISLLQESFAGYSDVGDTPGMASCLSDLAGTMQSADRMELAARLLGAATALRSTVGAAVPPIQRGRQERFASAARSALGERAYGDAWAAGALDPVEKLVGSATIAGVKA